MNVHKLRGKMVEKQVTVVAAAEYIGIDKSTFYRKMDSQTFTIKEANLITKLLELTSEEAMLIFFNKTVAW